LLFLATKNKRLTFGSQGKATKNKKAENKKVLIFSRKKITNNKKRPKIRLQKNKAYFWLNFPAKCH
jgi:hypothetical protein